MVNPLLTLICKKEDRNNTFTGWYNTIISKNKINYWFGVTNSKLNIKKNI